MALPKLNTPKYNLNIPSTGKEITYRPYLVREEKILMIAMESEDIKQIEIALLDIISACTDESCNTDKMTRFDTEYIFSKLRSKSVGETSEVGIKCEKCSHENKVVVEIDAVQVTEKPDTKIDLAEGTGIVMKFPSMKDYKELQSIETDSDVDAIFNVIISSIESIYQGEDLFQANEHTKQELHDFVDSLNTVQFKKIQQFISDMPQAYINVKFDCEECNHSHDHDLKGMANFFG